MININSSEPKFAHNIAERIEFLHHHIKELILDAKEAKEHKEDCALEFLIYLIKVNHSDWQEARREVTY